ncbi:MAG TPA: Uma2 family endonuclease [Bryobacteraceae bacterium]|nr:Uma2 family endonuclease [Bryobacteraceae bacterium]
MSVTHLVSVKEYLSTAYRPDCDYVEGVLEERNLGEHDHSLLHALLAEFLGPWSRKNGCKCLIEQRVQVRADRFRIPDVCLIAKDDRDRITRRPPLLCIEILSPEDTHTRLVVRLDDYLAMGVPECWVIDPKLRRGYTYTHSGLIAAQEGVLTLTGTSLSVDLAPLFAQL